MTYKEIVEEKMEELKRAIDADLITKLEVSECKHFSEGGYKHSSLILEYWSPDSYSG